MMESGRHEDKTWWKKDRRDEERGQEEEEEKETEGEGKCQRLTLLPSGRIRVLQWLLLLTLA